jgi:hypothetical protein
MPDEIDTAYLQFQCCHYVLYGAGTLVSFWQENGPGDAILEDICANITEECCDLEDPETPGVDPDTDSVDPDTDPETYLYYGCSDCLQGEGQNNGPPNPNQGPTIISDWNCLPLVEVEVPAEVAIPYNGDTPVTGIGSAQGGVPEPWGYGGHELWWSQTVNISNAEAGCTGTIGQSWQCAYCEDEAWSLGYDAWCNQNNCPEPEGQPGPGGISIDTPGAPQPKDYRGGGTDPQYLKDKQDFINRNQQTSLRERFQKLAGIKKRK